MRLAHAALAALLAAAPTGAQATGLSLNHEQLPPGTTMAACIARGATAIAAAGLRSLDTTTNAAWGEDTAGRGRTPDTLYAIYCTPDGRFAFFVGAAPQVSQVDPVVSQLIAAFRAAGSVGGTRK
jgi:hypothetical protein